MFASFPPEVQEKVRQGKIEMGFSRDMVFIALGAPHRVYARQDGGGATEIWSYEDCSYETDFVPVHRTYWYHDAEGRLRLGHDWFWADVQRKRAEEALRVEFDDDKVTAIEALTIP